MNTAYLSDYRIASKIRHRALAIGFIGDLGVTAFALTVAYVMRFETFLVHYGNANPNQQIEPYLPLLCIAIGFFMSTFAHLGMYSDRRILQLQRNTASIVKGATFWLVIFLSFSLAIKFDPQVSRVFVAFAYVSVIISLVSWRWTLHKLLILSPWINALQRRIIIFGSNEKAAEICGTIDRGAHLPYQSIGYVGKFNEAFNEKTGLVHLGQESELSSVLDDKAADMLVVTERDVSNDRMLNIAQICEKHHVEFKIIPSSFQVFLSGLQLQNLCGVPLLGIEDLPINHFLNRVLKRCIDILGGAIGCVISAPFIFLLGILIRRENPGPVYFRQERIGEKSRRFHMIKLRSMQLGADAEDHLYQSTLRNDPRVLKIGQFMRKWNLDELPQFWNILKGDMSLVGPRPERTYHVSKLVNQIPHYGVRHIVKPGLTGWAQIRGLRGNTDLNKRIQYDIFYIENWSFWMDLYIMLLTLLNIRRGAL